MRDKITECWLAETQGIFFLIKKTLGNQEGMITLCWLAEHACIKLVPASNGFWKGISETHRNKAQSFGGKAKVYWFAAWKTFELGRLVSHEA